MLAPTSGEGTRNAKSGDEAAWPKDSTPLDPDLKLPTERLYFGRHPMGVQLAALEPWAPGEEPHFVDFSRAGAADTAAAADPLNKSTHSVCSQPNLRPMHQNKPDQVDFL